MEVLHPLDGHHYLEMTCMCLFWDEIRTRCNPDKEIGAHIYRDKGRDMHTHKHKQSTFTHGQQHTQIDCHTDDFVITLCIGLTLNSSVIAVVSNS